MVSRAVEISDDSASFETGGVVCLTNPYDRPTICKYFAPACYDFCRCNDLVTHAENMGTFSDTRGDDGADAMHRNLIDARNSDRMRQPRPLREQPGTLRGSPHIQPCSGNVWFSGDCDDRRLHRRCNDLLHHQWNNPYRILSHIHVSDPCWGQRGIQGDGCKVGRPRK